MSWWGNNVHGLDSTMLANLLLGEGHYKIDYLLLGNALEHRMQTPEPTIGADYQFWLNKARQLWAMWKLQLRAHGYADFVRIIDVLLRED